MEWDLSLSLHLSGSMGIYLVSNKITTLLIAFS